MVCWNHQPDHAPSENFSLHFILTKKNYNGLISNIITNGLLKPSTQPWTMHPPTFPQKCFLKGTVSREFCYHFCVRKIRQSVFAYICVAHTAVCMYVWHESELRMRVVKTFERRQQSADDCLRIFVHGNVLLPWVYDTHAWTFPLVYVTHTLLPSLLSRMFPCCNSRPNISSSSCHWAPWAALQL